MQSPNEQTAIALSGLSRCLIKEALLDEKTVLTAQQQANQRGVPLINHLLGNGILSELDIAQAAAKGFGLPLYDLGAHNLDPTVLALVNEELIRQRTILPIHKRGKEIFIAISDPSALQVLDEIRFHTGLIAQPVVVEQNKLLAIIEIALDEADTTLEDLNEVELAGFELSQQNQQEESDSTLEQEVNDTPVVRFINKILLDAIKRGASDIHFEPYEGNYRIRFRMDGILQEIASPPSNLSTRLAARLKIMSQLDISERRVPQDGRIKIHLGKKRFVDFRVNTLPTLFGEKIVLRILDTMNSSINIENLGFSEKQKELFEDAIKKPYGMILVTGPTGSGKTVTLYSALNTLNTPDRNISTAEDPAEIYLHGVNQVNINPKAGVNFATALRAFLRQDPDIIMVGEIRDLETGEIAIKAAQTGHLVLSTLHTNDAPNTLTRLVNMGIAPYNIASTISIIIAQRLVRKLCPHCKEQISLPEEALLKEGFSQEEIPELSLYSPVGCDKCNNGYRGRTGIFQVLPVSDAIGRIIMEGGNAIQIADQTKIEGIEDLRRSGLDKIKQGITSLEEINRVTRD